MSIKHKLGWRPDKPDKRDRYYEPVMSLAALPPKVDIGDIPIWQQGDIGSCTANAILSGYVFTQVRQELQPMLSPPPSRLFLYYNERWIEGTTQQDAGAELRDGMKALARWGVCNEEQWPYDTNVLYVEPPSDIYKLAKPNRILKYFRIRQNVPAMRECLASGYPFVFGFSVYTSFESDEVAKTGVMPMPSGDEPLLGGHAVEAVGYDDEKKVFKIRNSWGTEWGDNGYFYMPYDFIADEDYAADFWTIRKVSR